MYGKIFAEIFDSSLQGECDGIAMFVFMSMIVLADKDGYVRVDELNFYRKLGLPWGDPDGIDKWALRRFREAIDLLAAPDENSNIAKEGGRRIIPLSELTGGEENRGWWIVNYEHYCHKASEAKIRAQTRKRVQRHRQKQTETMQKCNAPVTQCNEKPRHIDIPVNIDNIAQAALACAGDESFAQFWDAYPKKRSKKDAQKAWRKLKPDDALFRTIMDAVAFWKQTPDWMKEKGAYVPLPATWLRGERWTDERPELPPPKKDIRETMHDFFAKHPEYDDDQT